ncbi:Ger(x)C family spore germination protein [Clostridium thailandense]|uniref:Ger(x)C family spore germination protein n=1 Tax=Clostridium thailandense TaxID=2794346 RepID=UPI0039891679
MNKKKYFIILIGIFLYVLILLGQDGLPIEETNIISGVGYDIEKKSEGIIDYILPLSINVYKLNGKISNVTLEEKGENIGEVIQNRQEKLNKKVTQGQERVVLISEKYARFGVKNIIEDRFRNVEINDMAFIAVCRGETEKYFKMKVKGYNSSAEYIEGLIESSRTHNFFSENYKLIDMYVRIDAEGKTLVLPYIEMSKEGIEIAGMTIFKEDKMVKTINLGEAKILNLLKESNVKGVVSLKRSPKEYVDFDAKTGKRKVKCYKEGEKYGFVIDLNLTGNIISNEMYTDLTKDIKKRKEFEEDMAKSIEEQCYDFIKIMQNQYKIDCIDLGKEAAAKFGRRKKVDWNRVVSNAEIKVNVKVKVEAQGRGDF